MTIYSPGSDEGLYDNLRWCISPDKVFRFVTRTFANETVDPVLNDSNLLYCSFILLLTDADPNGFKIVLYIPLLLINPPNNKLFLFV